MARPLRIEYPHAVYHVTSRGDARRSIFRDDEDKERFLAILGIVTKRYHWLCHAYCLMDNHYHLPLRGQIFNLDFGGGPAHYAFIFRMPSIMSGGVSHPGRGSRVRTGLPSAVSAMTYNAANQLTNWNGSALTYDDNGNLTDDGTNTYTWNARNQLASMTGASFVYDGLGRRASKTIGGSTTNYLYDGQNPVQEGSATLLTGLAV
jgi:hypothetical protein